LIFKLGVELRERNSSSASEMAPAASGGASAQEIAFTTSKSERTVCGIQIKLCKSGVRAARIIYLTRKLYCRLICVAAAAKTKG